METKQEMLERACSRCGAPALTIVNKELIPCQCYYDGPFGIGNTVFWPKQGKHGEVCWSTKKETCVNFGIVVSVAPTCELEFTKKSKPGEIDVEFLLKHLKGKS